MRFYFHIFQVTGDVLTDEIGLVLPDLGAARREASRAIASFVRDAERGGPDYRGMSLFVASEDHRHLFSMPFPQKTMLQENGSAPVMPASLATHQPGQMHGAGGLAQPLSDKRE